MEPGGWLVSRGALPSGRLGRCFLLVLPPGGPVLGRERWPPWPLTGSGAGNLGVRRRRLLSALHPGPTCPDPGAAP